MGHHISSSDEIKKGHSHEHKTGIVVIITAVTMVAEIFYGYFTNSMALLADGYHMVSHVLALGLAWIAYFIARKYARSEKVSFNKEKLLALSGFTSAITLQIVAIAMAYQSIERLLSPLTIRFNEAIIVAIIGLVVNIVSAMILHHKHEDGDLNIRGAYLHVLADTLTSLTAIIALTVGLFYDYYSLDSISGIISSLIITKWAIQLMYHSGKELVEFKRVDK